MELADYFNRDDGSLPEIEVQFDCRDGVVKGLKQLFAHGASDVTVGGARLWMKKSGESQTFEGPEDAELVIKELAEPFHIVLAGIDCAGMELPWMGVLVLSDALVLDYRMGPEWGAHEIDALLWLLLGLRKLGGRVSATKWWGSEIARLLQLELSELGRD